MLRPLEPKTPEDPKGLDFEFIPTLIAGPGGAEFLKNIRSYTNALAIVSHSVQH